MYDENCQDGRISLAADYLISRLSYIANQSVRDNKGINSYIYIYIYIYNIYTQ